MSQQLSTFIDPADVQDFRMFLYELMEGDRRYWLTNDLLLEFERFCEERKVSAGGRENSSIRRLLEHTPELIVHDGEVVLVHRYKIAHYRAYQISLHSDRVDLLSVSEVLDFKDRFVRPELGNEVGKLKIDFMPFYDYGPRIRDVRRIGDGIDFLNKHMSSSLFQHPDKWNRDLFEFLQLHSFDHQQLLIDPRLIPSPEVLSDRLESVIGDLAVQPAETSWETVMPQLTRHGFEPGWGDTVGRILHTMQLLLDLMRSPDSSNLEQFISRIPMTFRVAILSPHGWFGQENVLGRPDTGGQIVYILDQVRALERILTERIRSFGLSVTPKILIVTRLIPENDGTTSNMRLEKVHFTENAHILRVPFTDEAGNVVPHWLSRFEVWPYLERFANACYHELQGEMNGKPDLIIGNYSDGNLVATLLARRFDVTQCSIAHALEKTKYLFSDLYWYEAEREKHFSLQFLADLISMNMADFIITSTHQEIYGSRHSPGQYESYQSFTLPGLLQVQTGVNLFHPKFNVIPPGVDEGLYFPFSDRERRLANETERLENRLFHETSPGIVGHLDEPERPAIFSMARLDRIKNITGLVEAYATSDELRLRANLIVVAGKTSAERSSDAEEREGIHRMHELFQEHGLVGQVRWLEAFPKEAGAEAYRIIAERGGVFVQPAKFEGFGLTVLEAMACGLPTFATEFGGPSEIIVDGKSGFLINPTVPELISGPLLEFYRGVDEDPDRWQAVSRAGIERVREAFTWDLYGNRLINMTKLYGFWRYSVASEAKEELAQYCHLLFHLLYKPRAEAMLRGES